MISSILEGFYIVFQIGSKLKPLFSDNGYEFASMDLSLFFDLFKAFDQTESSYKFDLFCFG